LRRIRGVLPIAAESQCGICGWRIPSPTIDEAPLSNALSFGNVYGRLMDCVRL
jgi:hypothetical protein